MNPLNGVIHSARAFDTYKSSEYLEEFISERIPEGHIIIAACMDDCVTELSDECTEWFEEMGSKVIGKLGYRCAFAFIGIYGDK